MKEVVLDLTWLDMIFLVIALASIGWNIVQFVESRKSFRPLKSNLIALFNDIKAKGVLPYQTQNVLFAPRNPHQSIETLRWEYALFCQCMITAFQGLQESVVGILVAVDPSDREGREAFRAGTYGLTAEEAAIRKKGMENWQRQHFAPTLSQARVGAAEEECVSEPAEGGSG